MEKERLIKQLPVSRFGALQRPRRGICCLKVCNASEAVLGPDPAGCFWIYPHSRTGTTSAVCRAPFGSRQAQRGRQLDPHPAQQQGQRRNPCRHVCIEQPLPPCIGGQQGIVGHMLAQVFGINDDPAAAVVIDQPVDGRIEEVDQRLSIGP